MTVWENFLFFGTGFLFIFVDVDDEVEYQVCLLVHHCHHCTLIASSLSSLSCGEPGSGLAWALLQCDSYFVPVLGIIWGSYGVFGSCIFCFV